MTKQNTLLAALQEHGGKVLPAAEALRDTLRNQRAPLSVALSSCLIVAAEAALAGKMTEEGFVAAAKMAYDSHVSVAALLHKTEGIHKGEPS